MIFTKKSAKCFLFFLLLASSHSLFSQDISLTVTGSGLTEEEAMKAALKEAVQQAIGAMVEAEEKIKNEEIISDQILTHSAGYVSECKKLDTKSKDGVFTVKIAAVVKRKNLTEKLKASNVAVKEISGESLFGEAITKIDEAKSAIEIIKPEFKDIPKSLIEAKAVSKPRYDEPTGLFTVDVEISINMKAYNAFGRRLSEKLTRVSDRQWKSVGYMFDKNEFYLKRPSIDENFKKAYIYLCPGMKDNGDLEDWEIFEISENIFKEIHDQPETVVMRLIFVDANKNTVSSSSFVIYYHESDLNRSNLIAGPLTFERNVLAVYPFLSARFEKNAIGYGFPSWYQGGWGQGNLIMRNWLLSRESPVFTIPFELELEKAKNVKEMSCIISNISEVYENLPKDLFKVESTSGEKKATCRYWSQHKKKGSLGSWDERGVGLPDPRDMDVQFIKKQSNP